MDGDFKPYQLEIEVNGNLVHLTLRCRDRYEALVTYEDFLERALHDGNVSIQFIVNREIKELKSA